MNRSIAFQWIEPCANPRLRDAQAELKRSVVAHGLEPLLFPAGSSLVKFRDILQFGRDHCVGRSLVWCNSDVILKRNPYEVEDGERIHGFHRTEIPSGEICGGVDMYLIPCHVWDDWLAADAPDLWCGATHIDWWLTRTARLRGIYEAHEGFITHLTHPPSGASKGADNIYYRHNIAAYNTWAQAAGVEIFVEKRFNKPPSRLREKLKRWAHHAMASWTTNQKPAK